jgi:hypothetical protein
MTPKTKPKAKKKGKLKPVKRPVSTLKRKRSKGQSTGRQSNRSVTRTKKISRPKKSIQRIKPTPRKQRSTVEESTSSSGPSTAVYESQEMTAFGSEINEDETMATSVASSPDENNDKQDYSGDTGSN